MILPMISSTLSATFAICLLLFSLSPTNSIADWKRLRILSIRDSFPLAADFTEFIIRPPDTATSLALPMAADCSSLAPTAEAILDPRKLAPAPAAFITPTRPACLTIPAAVEPRRSSSLSSYSAASSKAWLDLLRYLSAKRWFRLAPPPRLEPPVP